MASCRNPGGTFLCARPTVGSMVAQPVAGVCDQGMGHWAGGPVSGNPALRRFLR
jgi:hypothetical protein